MIAPVPQSQPVEGGEELPPPSPFALLAALEGLEAAVSADPDHAEGLPFRYRAAVEVARAAIQAAKGAR